MTTDIHAMLQELLDRQRIWDCLLRYTRGVDRLDRELMLQAFHPDARIQQGSFLGSRNDLADWVLNHHQQNQVLTQHWMLNHFCELDGDTAHTETCVAYYGTNPPETKGDDDFAVGRYIDRLQKCGEEWLIVTRVCTTEGTTNFTKNGLMDLFKAPPGSLSKPTRDRRDPSYLRPLVIPNNN